MKNIKLPLQRVSAEFAVDQANAERRTIPMVWYTGATVLQFSWQDGLHYLRLSMDPNHVRLGRMNSGTAPLLNGHDETDLSRILGVILKDTATIENGKGRADVKFSSRPDVQGFYQDVLDGVIRNVSVGAILHKLKEITAKEDKMKTFLAVDWEPVHVAACPVGADPGAHFKASENITMSECEIEFSTSEVALRLREIEIAKLRM